MSSEESASAGIVATAPQEKTARNGSSYTSFRVASSDRADRVAAGSMVVLPRQRRGREMF